MVSHDGSDAGFHSGLALLPDRKIAVVWMTNAHWLQVGDEITRAALDTALGLEPHEIKGKPVILQAPSSKHPII